MDKKEEKAFESYIDECWALHKDTYPERDIDPYEFRQQGLLKWNGASHAHKIRFFDDGSRPPRCSRSEKDVVNLSITVDPQENLSDCFVNFSRQMRSSVSVPGDTVSKTIMS